MDIQKHLLFLKGEEKTDTIKNCEEEGNLFKVRFNQGSKIYTYKKEDVEHYENPEIFDHEKAVVSVDGEPLSGIEKILNFGEYVRVVFKSGFQKPYHKNQVSFEKSSLGENEVKKNLEYLKELSKLLGTDEEDGFLSKQIHKITTLSSKAVLSGYLSSRLLCEAEEAIDPVFPFGFNLSQQKATRIALAEPVSIIEGPPGTGKTQTILNIIANAVMNGKTVAVVSNNNSATANVQEKLEKYGVGFISASLGNKDNVTRFFEDQPESYPDFSEWMMEPAELDSLRQTVLEKTRQLNEMLAFKNEAARLKQLLSEAALQKDYFGQFREEKYGERLSYRSFRKHDSQKAIELSSQFEDYARLGKKPGFFGKLGNLIRHGIYSRSFYDHPTDAIIGSLQYLFYEELEKELEQRLGDIEEKLEAFQFETVLQEYTDEAMRLFKADLFRRFAKEKRPCFEARNFRLQGFKDFIAEYPVILSTTHSLRNSIQEGYLFDYLIVDEASQADIVSGALALSCARNAVIVGDQMQLPHIVPDEIAEAAKEVFLQYDIPEAYDYTRHSLLSSVDAVFADFPRTMLREHYRCHPKIIDFCNKKFYEGKLVIMTEDDGDSQPLFVHKTVPGNHARGTHNQRQIEMIQDEVVESLKLDLSDSIGVMSPYREQVRHIRQSIDPAFAETNTVHKYQGREKDIVLLTTVSNKINSFIDDPHLVNVAVSRAIKALVVVISDKIEDSKGNLGDLIRYIKYNNYEVIQSEIHSVFDLLYQGYATQYFSSVKGKKNASEYASENLMNMVIETVLDSREFCHLGHALHVRLDYIIKETEKLNEKERDFVGNSFTHVDFLIYNKLDRQPVLAVEVDGYAFHDENPEQQRRDHMKNRILQKYDIPIMRFKTIESREEQRLRRRLEEILDANK